MEVLARAVPEPLGKLAQWRELSERLKIEGGVQELVGSVSVLFHKGRANPFIPVCFLLLFSLLKHC